ncbi:hypothetical protein TIFTF001_015701 [Ficus carica]|uniref:Uncharacterized protein n=1 Tax=Ficus carica TaxID=3494 RepID=A0AA88D842_FICCA|nr:hypothetical protein TIFTF001_015701 [Ficus carica]
MMRFDQIQAAAIHSISRLNHFHSLITTSYSSSTPSLREDISSRLSPDYLSTSQASPLALPHLKSMPLQIQGVTSFGFNAPANPAATIARKFSLLLSLTTPPLTEVYLATPLAVML